jgi:glucose/arabinose dehydrogenase
VRRFLLLFAVLLALPATARGSTLPLGFTETTQWSGLGNPTVVRFAPDGRVFVAAKSGLVYVFDSLDDTTPSVYADLRTKVDDYWDRGLLGLAIDGQNRVFVLYTYDKAPGSTQVPRWNDACPSPPGPTDKGCVVTGRLSRLSASGAETVLIEDWCQQYPSHSVGSLEFGPDGMLYSSAGDGASFNWADYGQEGNPCGDPANAGGALRAQSFRGAGQTLDGAILRLNPETGAAAAGNPVAGNRIVAHGFRNPFRFTFRPGTSELWAGDVGWNTWEEIDRIPDTTAVRNYGWPCFEGAARMSAYDNLNVPLCESLYSGGSVVAPHYAYNHSEKVVAGESCTTGSSSISGLAFYTGAAFPASYSGALFFADYSRNCIWVMFPGADGVPDPATRQTFAAGAAGPVWLAAGPDGALYYADLSGGTVRRIAGPNSAPTARIGATPSSGPAPLTVGFDGTASTDPEGKPLTYAWDLDGDGAYDDSAAAKPSYTYASAGNVTVRLRVTDAGGLTGTTSTVISVGAPPTVTITAPAAGTTWAVGDTIGFSGSGPNLKWALDVRHCAATDATVCHTHHVQDFTGSSGSFVAPDHEYPSYLQLTATATNAAGQSASATRRLDPRTVRVTLASAPAGMALSLGSETAAAPFTRTLIERSATTVSAPGSAFTRWSDGLAATHSIVATANLTLTASYASAGTALLGGYQEAGANTSRAYSGGGEVYRFVAAASGTAESLALRLDPDSTATKLVLGLYGDDGGEAGELLGAGSLDAPAAGAWATVRLPSAIALQAGRAYWFALLNPADGSGILRWRDRPGTVRDKERTSFSKTLAALPSRWATAAYYDDGGPVSGAVYGTAAVAPRPTPAPTPQPQPATPPPVEASGELEALPRATIPARLTASASGSVSLRVRCPRGTCRFAVSVGRAKVVRRVKGSATIRVRLSARDRRTLSRRGRLNLRVRIDRDGAAVERVSRVTMRRAKH